DDAVGRDEVVARGAGSQRDAPVYAEQQAAVRAHRGVVTPARLVLDHDREVVQARSKLFGQRIERVPHHVLEQLNLDWDMALCVSGGPLPIPPGRAGPDYRGSGTATLPPRRPAWP